MRWGLKATSGQCLFSKAELMEKKALLLNAGCCVGEGGQYRTSLKCWIGSKLTCPQPSLNCVHHSCVLADIFDKLQAPALGPQFALGEIILLSRLILSCVRVSCFCEKGEWLVVSCCDTGSAGYNYVVTDFSGPPLDIVNSWGGLVAWNNLLSLHKRMSRENPR